MSKQLRASEDPEIVAISEVYLALKDLESDARSRVLNYVIDKFNIQNSVVANRSGYEPPQTHYSQQPLSPPTEIGSQTTSTDYDEFEGISPAGKKWITRSGINVAKLMSIFSLGIEEIDLVSKSVPGDKKNQRMRNIFLLKGLAAYLGTGAARFTHEQAKETCLHYDAWDTGNFAVILKSMSADVSGTKDIGYTLTSKGLTEATSLVKAMSGG